MTASCILGFPIRIVVHARRGLFTSIFFSLHCFSSLIYHFFSSHALFPPVPGRFGGILASKNALTAFFEDTSSVFFGVLTQFISSCPYPGANAGILRLSIALRMSRNYSRGTAFRHLENYLPGVAHNLGSDFGTTCFTLHSNSACGTTLRHTCRLSRIRSFGSRRNPGTNSVLQSGRSRPDSQILIVVPLMTLLSRAYSPLLVSPMFPVNLLPMSPVHTTFTGKHWHAQRKFSPLPRYV